MKRLIRQNNKKFKESINKKISDLEDNNPKEFWNLVNKLKNDKQNKTEIDLDETATYFESLYKPKKLSEEDKKVIKHLNTKLQNGVEIEELDNPISSDEILLAIKSSKNGKSSGPDLIINEMIKAGKETWTKPLLLLFNLILNKQTVPLEWNTGFVTPIFKGGDQHEMNNYRGITVTSNLSKLFTKIMNSRLTKYLDKNKMINNEQIGFRSGCRTSDHLFVLKTIIDCYKRQKKHVYACFVDLSKAFDTVWREGLYFKMIVSGLSTKFVKLIQSMYTNVRARIKIDNHLSREFCVRNGTKQGCNFSPSLFNLYINDLISIINKSNCNPVRLADKFLSVLLYADDIVLLSENRKGLQQMLNILNAYCLKWKLSINVNKTKIVIFNSRKHFQFTLGSKVINNSNHYTYLGIEIKRDGSFSSGIQNLVTKANRAYFSWNKNFNIYNGTPLNTLVKLYSSTVKPILLYGSEIWGAYLPQLQKNELFKLFMNNNFGFEKLNNRFCHMSLGVKRNTSNMGCKAELGIYPIVVNILENIIKYFLRINVMETDSLVSCALRQQQELYFESKNRLEKCSYINTVYNILNFLDIYTFEVDPKSKVISHKSKEIMKRAFRTKYESVFKQMYKSEIAERKKLRTYFLVKKSFKQEGYLTSVKSVKYRRAFTKIRLSDHCLPIEKLRKSNVPEERRFCTLCHSNRIGNEEHIFNCTNPDVASLRNAFLSTSISLVPQLDHLSLTDKFIYILSGCDESIIELTL